MKPSRYFFGYCQLPTTMHALLTTSACINLCVQLRTITTNARYRKPYYYAFAKLHAVRPSGYY